ncbi:MAG: biopolymer transporter ExbD [Bacteriovorax sp.]|nr:biopolymer transporter ExbD [Bacteriovorax sp.]MBC7712686.1 biopolymer transporter ExbD [Bacteriovorax sp.]
MAFNTGKKKGAISDINVTPLVDVMLVLLVIFMVTAPLMLNGIKLDLPKTKEVNPVNLNNTQVILSLSKSEDYFLGKDKVLLNEIIPEINKQFKANKTDTVFLRADFSLAYGKVAKLMSFLKRGGIHHIALVTVTEDKK